ncbi:MAG: oligosaccharide flippase family protein [Caryophanon sp.]|nr:oligosaccharide flippase family protein [Caryophanon sp.]
MKEIKIGAILSYLGIAITVMVTLIYTPILTKQLGQAEYGVYMLIGSLVTYLTILDMGLGNAIVRYISREQNNETYKNKLIGMFLILFTVLGVIVLFLGIIITGNLHLFFYNSLTSSEINLAQNLMFILTLNYAFSFPLSVFSAVIQAHEKFIFLKSLNILRSLLAPLIIVPLLYIGYGSITVVLVTTIVNISFLLINVYYAFVVLKIKVIFNLIDRNVMKEIITYSFFVFLVAVMDKIYWSTDQVLLGMYSGATNVAVYALAMQFINLFMILSTVINGLYLPKLSKMDSNFSSDSEFSNIFISVGTAQTILLSYFILGFLLVGKNFINLWVGESYNESYIIVCIIILPLLIIWGQTIGTAILQAKNKHKFRAVVYLIVAVLNIIISIPVTQAFGGIGTAIVTALSLIISHIVVMNIYYYKVINIDIKKYWLKASKIYIYNIIIFVCLWYLFQNISFDNWWGIFAKIIIFSIVYTSVIYTFILDKKVKNEVNKKLRGKRG